jgi:hypothetical protein
MIGSGDDVDRTAKNPNRITQPFNMIGKGEDVSEMEARERFWWAKVRQAMKMGKVLVAYDLMEKAWLETRSDRLRGQLERNIANTFKAGCAALRDPAPLDKEQDHE